MAEQNGEPRYLVDTGILVQHIRQTKTPTIFDAANAAYGVPVASIITAYEIDVGGAIAGRANEFDLLFADIEVLVLDRTVERRAATLRANLRRFNQSIGLADTLIAATALVYELPLLTPNKRHFERVPDLQLLDIPDR